MNRAPRLRKFVPTMLLLAAAVLMTPLAGLAQTKIKPPRNLFGVKDDVKFGREAAREAEGQVKVLRDPEVTQYVESVGRRLVAALPPEYQHPEFRYTFKVVNDKDLNAFSLPGGPIYINRGMIEASRNEGELAGVIAHEISHVALRHGTSEMGKKLIALVGLEVLAAALGDGKAGKITEAVGAVGLSVYFLKFSRKNETQADIMAAQLMARAGYDPQDLANVFQLLERKEGRSGPQWLSDHPNPGNRYDRILQETALLNVSPYPIRGSEELGYIQDRLRYRPRGFAVGASGGR